MIHRMMPIKVSVS
uniref:Uncharacterized protein n=1 Tax=Arundo donax TaxID=35708 RepID=A0A0A8YKL5_ARUDO